MFVLCDLCFCRKVVTLQLLAGYLGLTGGHVSLMLHSLPHLSCLVQALVQVRVRYRVAGMDMYVTAFTCRR